MTEHVLGSTTVTQIGTIVQDVEAKARAWVEVLGLPMPEIILTDGYERAQTEYNGKPSDARAKMAFFHLGQVDLELIEPVGKPSTWRGWTGANRPGHCQAVSSVCHPGQF